MLLLFLSLSWQKQPGKEDGRATVVTLEEEVAAENPVEPRPERQEAAQRQGPQQPPPPQPPRPAQPVPPTPPPVPSLLPVQAPPLPPAAAAPSPARPAPARPVYGPPDTRPRNPFPDSERVGTAPNGEPLYAAAWYREPNQQMLGDYLSTARSEGWGLIACRTAPDYRVEDCVGLAEYPEGSLILRSILAAAWEFKVRPPRLGGQSLVGSWVRIRIDYQRRSGSPRPGG